MNHPRSPRGDLVRMRCGGWSGCVAAGGAVCLRAAAAPRSGCRGGGGARGEHCLHGATSFVYLCRSWGGAAPKCALDALRCVEWIGLAAWQLCTLRWQLCCLAPATRGVCRLWNRAPCHVETALGCKGRAAPRVDSTACMGRQCYCGQQNSCVLLEETITYIPCGVRHCSIQFHSTHYHGGTRITSLRRPCHSSRPRRSGTTPAGQRRHPRANLRTRCRGSTMLVLELPLALCLHAHLFGSVAS